MKKSIILFMIFISIISILQISAFENPSTYQSAFSKGGSIKDNNQNLPSISDIVIVFGKNSASNDYEAAKLIKNNLLTNYNVKLIYDTDYIDDGESSVISIGGSCINKVSAQFLELNYPKCGNEFTSKTKVSSNQYLIKTSSLSNNRIAILIAGYDSDDTWKAARYFNSLKINNITTDMNLIKENTWF